MRDALRAGDPAIHVGTGGYRDEINVVMTNVQPGEERLIADRLEEILSGTGDAGTGDANSGSEGSTS